MTTTLKHCTSLITPCSQQLVLSDEQGVIQDSLPLCGRKISQTGFRDGATAASTDMSESICASGARAGAGLTGTSTVSCLPLVRALVWA